MKDTNTDPKQTAILIAAWQALSTYGYRKTSMDDIAREAGMSRPALYRFFRNKEDINRSLVQQHYDIVSDDLRQRLSGPGSLLEVLLAAFEAHGGAFVEHMLTSTHGMELLDAGKAIAGDIVADGEAGLRDIYTEWLKAAATRGDIDLPDEPESVALAMTAALKGILVLGTDFDTYCRNRRVLAQMFVNGLSRR